MKELVFLQNDEALTTSLKVAEVFGKRHDRVLRAIETAISTLPKNGDSEKAFIKSSYTDSTGKSNPMYYLNRDGFTFVVMGFTGVKAAKFKWDYIQAFNAMEQKITQLAAERQSAKWLDIRQSTKFTQRKVTDAIKEYVIPNARKSGSTAPDKVFYMNYNKLFNKVANVPAGQRDNLTVSQLIMLDQMQDVAAANIRIKAKHGAGYKEIYSGTKNAVEGYAQIALVQERLLGTN